MKIWLKKLILQQVPPIFYFNNKESLFVAVNVRINKEINQSIKKKMDLFKTGSEEVVATETAIVEFSILEPEK